MPHERLLVGIPYSGRFHCGKIISVRSQEFPNFHRSAAGIIGHPRYDVLRAPTPLRSRSGRDQSCHAHSLRVRQVLVRQSIRHGVHIHRKSMPCPRLEVNRVFPIINACQKAIYHRIATVIFWFARFSDLDQDGRRNRVAIAVIPAKLIVFRRVVNAFKPFVPVFGEFLTPPLRKLVSSVAAMAPARSASQVSTAGLKTAAAAPAVQALTEAPNPSIAVEPAAIRMKLRRSISPP